MKKLFLLGLLSVALNAHAQSDHDNGGDEAERRWNSVRSNMKSWIQQGGHLGLQYRGSDNAQTYQQKMLGGLEIPVEFVSVKDPRTLVEVSGLQKMCRNVVEENKMRLRCVTEAVLLIRDSEFINIVHHEYAGIAGLETTAPSGTSDYYYTNQLVSSIETQISYRLVVKPVVPDGYEKLSINSIDYQEVDQDFNVLSNRSHLDQWVQFSTKCDEIRGEIATSFARREENQMEKSYLYSSAQYDPLKSLLICELDIIAKTGKYEKKTATFASEQYNGTPVVRDPRVFAFFYLVEQMESGFILKSKIPIFTNKQPGSVPGHSYVKYQFDYLVTKNSTQRRAPKSFEGFPEITQSICKSIAGHYSILVKYNDALAVPQGLLREKNGTFYPSACTIQKTKEGLFEVQASFNKRLKVNHGTKLNVSLLRSILGSSSATLTFDQDGKLLKINTWAFRTQRSQKTPLVKIKVDGKIYRGTYTAP